MLNKSQVFTVRNTAQKLKFPILDFFSKYDQIRRKLKSLMENLVFCAGK